MAAKKAVTDPTIKERLLSVISELESKVESGEIETFRDFKSAAHVEFLKNK